MAERITQTLIPARTDNPQPILIEFGTGKGSVLPFLKDSGAVSASSAAVDLLDLPPGSNRGDLAVTVNALEGLPFSLVPEALETILRAAPHGLLRVATRPAPHRLTVLTVPRWLELIEQVGRPIREYRVAPGAWLEIVY
jgi:hypothetical protein